MERGDRVAATRVDKAITGLATDPRPAAATKLVGAEAWRLRVGDYRVDYTIADAVKVVTVVEIGPDGNVYDR